MISKASSYAVEAHKDWCNSTWQDAITVDDAMRSKSSAKSFPQASKDNEKLRFELEDYDRYNATLKKDEKNIFCELVQRSRHNSILWIC